MVIGGSATSLELAGQLRALGHDVCDDQAPPDVIVVVADPERPIAEREHLVPAGEAPAIFVTARPAARPLKSRAPLTISTPIDPMLLDATLELAVERTRAVTRGSEARFTSLFEFAPDAILIADASGRIVLANPMAAETFGYTREELQALPVEDLLPPIARAGHVEKRAGFQASPESRRHAANRPTLQALRKDGSTVAVEISLSPFRSDGASFVAAVIRDVTTRVRAEEQRARLEADLRQAQKLEALGKVAGGIAHDFNNLLAAIAANVEVLRADLAAGDPTAPVLAEIADATTRGADLVRQILAFSRQKPIQRSVTNIRPVVAEVARLLRATLPPGIQVHEAIAPDTPSVRVHATQLHQVLMNLGTNAGQAIEHCGNIAIHVEPFHVPHGMSPRAGALEPGHYACIEVTDDGRGLDPATAAHIFDPFFTTKVHGTGLGLAVVHGIVTSHGGVVTANAGPQRGASFSVYLPAANGVAAPYEAA